MSKSNGGHNNCFPGLNSKFLKQFNGPAFTFATINSSTTKTVNRLVSGFGEDEEFPGGCKLFVKTGDDWVWGNGATSALVEGEWVALSFDLDTPDWEDEEADSPYDAGAVVEVGIECASDEEDGTYTEAIILLDNIQLAE